MLHDHDPVDSALKSLRSQAWTGTSFNPKLEETLMQEFARNQAPRRILKMPVWLAASLGVLLAGGAATGTVAFVRSWLVTVQIGDQQYQFQTDDSGEGNIQVQTDDGRTANVHVKRVEGENGAEETNVNVNVADEKSSEQKVMRIVRKPTGGGAPGSPATVEDLAGTEPTAVWTGADGRSFAAHFVSAGENQAQKFYLVTTNADGAKTVRLITELPSILFAGGARTEVTPGESGEITLRIANGNGNVNVMKLKVAGPGETVGNIPVSDQIQIDPQAGKIKINADRPPQGE